MHTASTRASTRVRASRGWFFTWFLSTDLAKIMHGYSILPGVVATRDQTGPMYETGTTREILFSDGTSAMEEIINSHPPCLLDYRVTRITSPFRRLIREGRAQLTFKELPGDMTSVEWDYTFYAHNWAASLLLRPLMALLCRGFLERTLARARDLAEEEATKQS